MRRGGTPAERDAPAATTARRDASTTKWIPTGKQVAQQQPIQPTAAVWWQYAATAARDAAAADASADDDATAAPDGAAPWIHPARQWHPATWIWTAMGHVKWGGRD